jgi:lysophospholipase L1-like esterase
MKTILCYGDSNTYGYNPRNGERYPQDVRWTGRLQMLLGEEYRIIEEGCNGRTTVFTDPEASWKNGLPYLRPCLNSHKPVDMVILMLGSNDLKDYFHASAQEIADGAGELVDVIRSFTEEKQGFVPQILLLSPPEIGEGIASSPFRDHFREDAIARSREFPQLYKKVARERHCLFFDTAQCIRPSEIDSLHLSEASHAALAEELFCNFFKNAVEIGK